MTLKRILMIGGALLALYSADALATWDITTPTGSEAKSLGDDRIRELKTDLQTSLQYLGNTSYFPGADTSNPRYIPTISTVTNTTRPSGNDAPGGRIIVNTSSTSFEIVDNAGSWATLDVIPSSGVTPSKVATTVAGPGLGGGAGAPLHIQIDTGTFTVASDTIAILPGGIGLSRLAKRPRFHVFMGASVTDVTGDGTQFTPILDSTVYDVDNLFGVRKATITTAGLWRFEGCVMVSNAAAASSETLLVQITASGGSVVSTYVGVPALSTDRVSACTSGFFDLAANETVSLSVTSTGGSKTVDMEGSTGQLTFFSGELVQLP